jgi:hypothetical protein
MGLRDEMEGKRHIPPISANLRSSKIKKCFLLAISLKLFAVRSVKSDTISA